MVESKVDHIEDTVSTNCCRYSFIDASESHAIFPYDLFRYLPSTWCLFGSVKCENMVIDTFEDDQVTYMDLLACRETLTTSNGFTRIASRTPAVNPAKENV